MKFLSTSLEGPRIGKSKYGIFDRQKVIFLSLPKLSDFLTLIVTAKPETFFTNDVGDTTRERFPRYIHFSRMSHSASYIPFSHFLPCFSPLSLPLFSPLLPHLSFSRVFRLLYSLFVSLYLNSFSHLCISFSSLTLSHHCLISTEFCWFHHIDHWRVSTRAEN